MIQRYKDEVIVYIVVGYMSLFMRNPVYAICEQQRRRSAWASAQSDQRLYCSLLESIINLFAISEISVL